MADVAKINDTTYRFEDGFVRFFLLIGKERAMLIDSGANCPDARKQAEALTPLPIILANTHGDGDHTSGTAAFDEIYMTSDDYDKCDVSRRYPGTVLHEVKDNDIFDLGGRTIRVITIPGHTYGSIALLDETFEMLFAGDSVQKGNIYMFGDKRDINSYEASLKKLISLESEYNTIFASHDEPSLPKDYATKVLKAWQSVENGEVIPEPVNLFGNEIMLYKTQYCGFYMAK